MRPCIGCGKTQVVGQTYCRRCKKRLDAGLPVDLDEYVTYRQSRKANAPTGTFSLGWKA